MVNAATHELSDLIKASLLDRAVRPWFPDLSSALADAEWSLLKHKCGLTIHNYGTARALVCDSSAPLKFVAYLATCSRTESFESLIPIEVLPSEIACQYEQTGLSFYANEEITGSKVLNCLQDAIGILKNVPGLLRTVAVMIRSLHLIRPETDEYDISFSEPDLSFSVFVSAPSKNSPVNALRVAEAMVHEAMHLQLTLIEKVVPLVNEEGGLFFSPWRGEYRTAQGMLHALYVFSAIDKFLEALSSSWPCPREVNEHMQKRRSEIRVQISEINYFEDCVGLTESGSVFARRLINR
jgi:hypothetical protein